MGIEAPAKVKYEIIREATSHDDNQLSIASMCKIAGVSRSGYYAWIKAVPARTARDERDHSDFELVLEGYGFRGYAKGARGIHMRLLHMGIRMNVKKIRRLMRKYGLFCPIRKANPARRMAKAMKTSHVAPNVVDRDFHSRGARKVLLTDITYLPFASGRCYLSTILDAVTHEVLSYELSLSFQVDFVLAGVDELIRKHGAGLDHTTIVHSDQGCHYTSNAFIQKLKDESFVQSMSRRGNCWDNAPQESFFGHMKDEIMGLIAQCQTYREVQEIIDDWMDYYNNDRYQWSLLKLSPAEYYKYLTTGFYPLPKYEPN